MTLLGEVDDGGLLLCSLVPCVSRAALLIVLGAWSVRCVG